MKSLESLLIVITLVFSLVFVVGCEDEDTDDGDKITNAAFGEKCTDDDSCASEVCVEFGKLSWVCTLDCVEDSQCPDGSEGQKCNKSGYCRP